MPAYFRSSVAEFLEADLQMVSSALTSRYAADGYFQLLGTQVKAWQVSLPLIRDALKKMAQIEPAAANWGVLLEYPLYRLRKRIDLVLLADELLFIVELKVGAGDAEPSDIRQVEEYALDLRDFHKASHDLRMNPILCCTELKNSIAAGYNHTAQIQGVTAVSSGRLCDEILRQHRQSAKCRGVQIDAAAWDASAYEPVPTIIEAATTIFAGHSVREISHFDADNLSICSQEVLRLVDEAREKRRKRIIVVAGVPGAGKTLAGLHVVHTSKNEKGHNGEIIYLSGNTPLVIVIREALAQDEKTRVSMKSEKKSLKAIRHELQSRIQHINDFLKEYYQHDVSAPPHEHAIVFDEAQRAWDHKHGKDKFGRDASEPELLMQIMDRHKDWAVIVCLVGAGQEINTGEPGMRQWGEALSADLPWEIVAPESALTGGEGMAGTAIFPGGVPTWAVVVRNDKLRLNISLRSYRSKTVSLWVDAVLEGRPDDAFGISRELGAYPIALVRSIDECRQWLKQRTQGTRRCGLLASSAASRLRAEGLGVGLTVQDKGNICHWYLKPEGDYRSSNALEVMANEYTSQGLEIDFAGVCWGGDFVRTKDGKNWDFRALRATSWNKVRNEDRQRFILNKYRVFLTRAREGMVFFVPRGDTADSTRIPHTYESVAKYLQRCGARTAP